MTSRVFNKWTRDRCVKGSIRHGGREFVFYIVKDPPAKSALGGIIVNDLFFKTYTKEERVALLYHEMYHLSRRNCVLQIPRILRYLSIKKANYEEEYTADRHAAKMAGMGHVIGLLKKSQQLYDKGLVKYNPKTHPTIDERIARLNNLASK